MLLRLVLEEQFCACHIGLQIVACMLEIGAHPQVLACLRLCEPVLSLNVVGLLLFCVEGRCYERQRGLVGEMARYVERAEECAEDVFLLTVEIDAERLHALHRSKLCLAVRWLKVVMVVGDVAHQAYCPSLVGRVDEVRLIVEVAGLVFALRLQRTEHILVCLVAQTVAPRQLLVAEPHIGACAEHTGCCCGFKAFGALVGYVESRRHLVAIFCFEAAC